MPAPKLRLGVNVDHVATLRNARGGARPDPVRAAVLALRAGADSITAHLREDRRHVRDADLAAIKARLDAPDLAAPLNFEMAATEEMVALAERLRPAAACLVPERREERTTEGGLDAAGGEARLAPLVARLAAAGCRVSLFVEADEAQLQAALRLGAPVVELHTGTWCEALEAGEGARAEVEFARLARAADRAAALGLEPHAGHGLDFESARRLAGVAAIAEFNIGHFLMGEAVMVGLPEAVRTMRAAMDAGRAGAA